MSNQSDKIPVMTETDLWQLAAIIPNPTEVPCQANLTEAAVVPLPVSDPALRGLAASGILFSLFSSVLSHTSSRWLEF